MSQIVRKCPKMSLCPKLSENVEKCLSRLWEKMIGNDWKTRLDQTKQVQTRQKCFRIVPSCPKLSQNAHFRRIVVQTDLLPGILEPFPEFDLKASFFMEMNCWWYNRQWSGTECIFGSQRPRFRLLCPSFRRIFVHFRVFLQMWQCHWHWHSTRVLTVQLAFLPFKCA